MKKRTWIWIAAVMVLLWLAAGTADFLRASSFERPLFCVPVDTAKDGGSGLYRGLGYSFDIKGNFMPEDELPGVTEYTYYLFGNNIRSGIRD